MKSAAEAFSCDVCGLAVPAGAGYIVRIEVFADPQMPPTTQKDLAGEDFEQVLSDLMEQMRDMSAEALQDGVYRQFSYRLCPVCQRSFLANPLGKPRGIRVGRN